MKHKVYVYGTLRPGTGEVTWQEGQMFDLGWFPGVVLGGDSGHSFAVECIEVDDEGLRGLDSYEGYYPESPSDSLYIRQPFLDGFLYEYNRQEFIAERYARVPGGDWLVYRGEKEGSNNGNRFSRR